jgi:tRNA threonylcarbamoyladenosine biosynthesis protein TsaE
MPTHTPKTEQEQINLGVQLVKQWKGGDIILLKGDLGTGKTTLAKGIAKGLGITQHIKSPTFTLMNVYTLETPISNIRQFVHVDTYRLENEQDLIDIGIEDYLGKPDTLVLIEWPEKIQNILHAKQAITILLEHITNKERKITIFDA